jgi:hypothetical protein
LITTTITLATTTHLPSLTDETHNNYL